jgi:hypothetical protein
MSDGRDKNLNLESFFTQSPEFYEELNNHGPNMRPPFTYQPQQWEYEPQFDPRFEDPSFHNMRARGGHYPKPAYHAMPPHPQHHAAQHAYAHYPGQPGYGPGGYPQPPYPQQPGPQRRHPQQPGPRPQGRNVPQQAPVPQPQRQYTNFGQKTGLRLPPKNQEVHIDVGETEELNSMLNILGLQIGTNLSEDPIDDERNFISKEIMLLEDGILKVFYKEPEGSYFSNIQTFGERLTKAIVDSTGKHIAVG